jgi:L-alanine-DL-glutamate epimerase-like enolase superfamily enzyme
VSIPLTMVHAGSMYVIQKTERTVVELALENGSLGLGETWGTPEVYALAQRFAEELARQGRARPLCAARGDARQSNYDNRMAATAAPRSPASTSRPGTRSARSMKLSLAELIGARKRESIDVVSTLPGRDPPQSGVTQGAHDHSTCLRTRKRSWSSRWSRYASPASAPSS